MAIRVTKSDLFIILSGDPAIRVTKSDLYVLVPTAGGAEELRVIAGDSLNNWGDAVGYVLNEPPEKSVSVTDSFTLSDAITVYLITPLADSVSSDGGVNWNDAISLLLHPNLTAELGDDLNSWLDSLNYFIPEGIERNVGSQFTLSDSIEVGNYVNLFETHADTLSLSDEVIVNLKYLISVNDNLNNWLDAIALPLHIPLTFSDSLSNWGDAVAFRYAWAFSFGDKLNFVDSIASLYFAGLEVSDSFSLTDTISLLYSEEPGLGDGMELSDEVAIGLYVHLSVAVEDDLNNWDDEIRRYEPTEEDDYYRRYMHDRLFLLGERKTFFVDRMEMRDAVAYELQ